MNYRKYYADFNTQGARKTNMARTASFSVSAKVGPQTATTSVAVCASTGGRGPTVTSTSTSVKSETTCVQQSRSASTLTEVTPAAALSVMRSTGRIVLVSIDTKILCPVAYCC